MLDFIVKRLGCAQLLASTLILSGCTLPTEQLALPGPITGSTAKTSDAGGGSGVPLSNPPAPETEYPRRFPGTGQFTGQPEPKPLAKNGATTTRDGITLNLVGASIGEVAKTILGDVLEVHYVVSDKVKGTITLRTSRPVAKEDLLGILESILRNEGAAMVVENGVYNIVPADLVAARGAPMRWNAQRNGRMAGGTATEIVPLRYISALEMERILKSAAPQTVIARVDSERNLLLVSGTSTELNSIRETVNVFDVDWMQGMSIAILPIESADPEAIATELDTIFANDRDSPTKGMVRFVPNRRLKSVLVIAQRPEYLTKAEQWLHRIDTASSATQKQVHVYTVQNRPAAELAVLLQKVYLGQATLDKPAGDTSQGQQPSATLSNSDTAPVNGLRASSPGFFSPLPLANPEVRRAQSDAPPPAATEERAATQYQPGDDRGSGISVVPDEPNNALVITASASEYRRIRQILSRIDIAPNQLLLEATIAEVTLNDRLRFGLRWYFQSGRSSFTLTDAPLGTVGPSFPGFSYFLNAPNVQVALNALSSVTDVNIVSSPSLTVIDNKKATLQIGDEVPIATQSATSVLAPGAPVVNSISFRSTGVILGITPRVADNGRVLLEIEQEVSEVVPTTTSKIDSPTIQQRRVHTTVAVNDGESIVLAGLMQDRTTVTKDQVPLLGSIPVVGNIFKQKDDHIRRTELLIAITPHLLKDANQIRAVAAEFRDRLNFSTRPQRRAPPDRREQIERTLVR